MKHYKDKYRTFKNKAKVVLKMIGKIIKVTTIGALIISLIAGIYIFVKVKPMVNNAKVQAYEKMSSIDKSTFVKLRDTRIFDDTGNKIGEINISNYKYAEINDISQFIKDGYVAVEDRNFAIHNGIDHKAIVRAGVALVRNKGAVTQGGSTITQQVLKNNVIGTDINKWDRKLLEFFLAPEFEKEFTKAEIMEFYCNSNFYQNNCYGVETACNYYFGKSAKDVTLAEAAIIVGLSNNPAKYNPVKHPEQALEKRHRVLEDMLECGKITVEQFNEADKEELKLVLEKETRVKESYMVSYALHCAALKLMETDGFEFKYKYSNKDEYIKYKEEYNKQYKVASDTIRGGGYDIYTSLNSEKQNKLQEILDTGLNEFTEVADDGRYAMQGSATIVDNTSGLVVAIVGGRGVEDEYNRGYQGFRQPGSSIKPILDYAPAFDTGTVYPSLKIEDKAIEGGPKNSNGRYLGDISVREAIARSTNTIAWRVFEKVGIDNGLSYLDKMEFSGLSYMDNGSYAISIGGFTYGATTSEMAKAYATLVNQGRYVDNNCLLKIEYQDGTIVFDGKTTPKQVYLADSAYMTLDCMRGVIEEGYGTGKELGIENVNFVGKTGTTNDKKDGWFCGVTDKYSVAVWCGYDIPREISDMSGARYPGQICRNTMIYLHTGLEKGEFIRPNTVEDGNIDRNGIRVDKKTGRTDLFSRVATERYEEAQRKLEEELRKQKEERAKAKDKQNADVVDVELREFESSTVSTIEELVSYNSDYKSIKKRINELKYVENKSGLLARLENAYSKMHSLNDVILLQKEIDDRVAKAEEEKRKAEEEKKKAEEKERQALKEKENKLNNAQQKLDRLSRWYNYPKEQWDVMLNEADKAIGECSEYSEANNMKSLFNSYKFNIETYKNSVNLDNEEEVKEKLGEAVEDKPITESSKPEAKQEPTNTANSIINLDEINPT